MPKAKEIKIKVVVNPTLTGWKKTANYKGDVYEGGKVYELPEGCLFYRTRHFGSIVPSFIREEAVVSLEEDDGTIIE